MEILENDPDVKRNLIVVGGSAGSLEVLRALAAGLPVDLDAAVLVVVHVPASVRSVLPQLRAGDELLVVDNGSTDGSREIAEKLGAAEFLAGRPLAPGMAFELP